MTFAIINIHTGLILDEIEDPGEAWDRLVDIEEETGQDCELKELKEV